MRMDSLAGGLLNLLGITGSGTATSDVAPRVTGPLAAERDLAAFTRESAVSDPNVWSYYNTTMNRPTTFDEMMRLWNDMSTWDMVTAALTELVEEASQPDPATDRTIWFECSDKALEDDLNGTMLVNVDAETVISSQLWYVAGFGNSFDKIQYADKEGVLGLSFAHPMDVRRYWLAENRRCVGFSWSRGIPNRETLFVQGSTRIERPTISAGTATPADIWYPWDFLHMRRMFRMRVNEHGEPVFDEAQGVYKKLRMAIDQMSVARAQLQPDRYVVNIDVQEQPPLEQVRTVHRWRQSLRNKMSFGQGDGSDTLASPTEFRSYYDAMALDTILWMAKPKGFSHSIEKLPGTASVPDVYDVEMLLNIFYSVIGMPKSWVGIGEPGANGPTSGRALLAQDMRFMRKVRALRKPVLLAYTWLAYFHALLKGRDIRSLDIKAKMSYIGTLEDQLRMEMLEKQVDIMTSMGDMLGKFNLDKEAWLDLVLRKYMHMPDDLVNALRTALPPEMNAESRRTSDSGSRRRLNEALDEIKAKLEWRYGKSLAKDLQRELNGEKPIAPLRMNLRELNRFQRLPDYGDINPAAQMLTEGLVVSSYDQFSNGVPNVRQAVTATAEQTGEPAYRNYIPKTR